MKFLINEKHNLIARFLGGISAFLLFLGFVIFMAESKFEPKNINSYEEMPKKDEIENIDPITTIWNSDQFGQRLAKKGEKCYGDKIVVEGKEYRKSIVVLSSDKKIDVYYGACVAQNYNLSLLQKQLKLNYPNPDQNWDLAIDL